VQVDDGVPRQVRGVLIPRAAAQAGYALDRHALVVVFGRRDGDGDRQRPVELVAPVHDDRFAALGFDRRPGDRPAVRPDRRRGKVAMKPVRRGAEGHRQLPVVLASQQTLR
jgi:hypothetical protein